ncbi:ThuA domain-containing protein [Micromonospora sp. RHAY321]|uniref:ThuA domain-containing protein n=1 Tax=Micromonospora sp. RHAY321 TaxID=2944807 RepID=UPI00207D2E06|nr:ThuA domain-containing protein [Micromonospora sp. RHAY321]MCO1597450.1 ThuA domain-containing protein [Micromonospora sp. RHAY321]
MTQPVDTIIFSGEGPHADPWHPLAETSAKIAEIVGDANSVTTVTSVGQLDAALNSVGLLVVNASANRSAPIPEDDDFARILDAFLARGGNLLATHSATIAFPGLHSWHSTIGAVWDYDRTFHPPIGQTLIRRSDVDHPIVDGLGDFEVYDERFTNLDLIDDGDSEPLYVHTENGVTHPLIWARTVGSSRVIYDGLGHDLRSYESPGHIALLRRAVSWLRHHI